MTGGVDFRDRDIARDSFLRAAAALTSWPGVGNGQSSADVIAFALLEVGIGLMHLVRLDPQRLALDLVVVALRTKTADATDPQ